MDDYRCANFHPLKQPFGVIDGEVDAAVTHRSAEAVVPVSTVNRIALMEVEDIGNIGEVVVFPPHPVETALAVDAEDAGGGGGRFLTGGDDDGVGWLASIPGNEALR